MTLRALTFGLLAAFAAAGLAIASSPAADQVTTDSGRLHGVAGDAAVAFKGIPYAAPPVGPLRWRPPQPAAPWTGVREASAFGPVCPQTPSRALPADAVQSEDCLTLNVWRPLPASHGAPVMVWLHGGGDDGGTATQPQFDGSAFAKDGIVFVSVDYRLGALGWFAHPALTREAGPGAPLANYGLMDEIAALQWVKRNIAAFGGDPAKVTVAGESAGGEAVLFLMTAPAAKGLFARAIVESGDGWADYPSLAQAEANGVAWAARAGAPADADAAALRTLPVAALVAANHGDTSVAVDGRLVQAAPADVFASGAAAPVPLLIGSNSGEDSLLGGYDPKAVLKDIAPADLAALRAAYAAEAPDDVTLGRDVFTDEVMGAPARWIAAHQAKRAPSFLYQFAYVPDLLRVRRTRANHGTELLFVFQAFDRAPIPLPASTGDTWEMTMLHGCWAGFVKTGTPGCPALTAWPAYSAAADKLIYFGNDGVALKTGYRKAAYDILERIEAAKSGGK